MDRRLKKLRDDFDHSFALPYPPEQAVLSGEQLCFTAAGERFAIPLLCLREIVKATPIVAVPSRARGLIGLTVVRAALMPLYSIVTLTGTARQPSEVCWVAVLRGDAPVALAIDSLNGYARRQEVIVAESASVSQFVNGAVEHNSLLYATLDGGSLYDALTHPSDFEKGTQLTS